MRLALIVLVIPVRRAKRAALKRSAGTCSVGASAKLERTRNRVLNCFPACRCTAPKRLSITARTRSNGAVEYQLQYRLGPKERQQQHGHTQ